MMSDHGLHYGIGDPVGAAHRTNPFLIVLWPKSLEQRGELRALQRSSTANLTTHLNVHGFLSGLAAGTGHRTDSIGAPDFPLNQSCDEAHVTSEECRCSFTGTCASGSTIDRAREELVKALRPASEHPRCTPLNASDFSVVWCRGDQTAHHVAFKNGRRIYTLSWDDRNADPKWSSRERTLTQQSAYKDDITPCIKEVPSSLYDTCICRSFIPSPKLLSKSSKHVKPSTPVSKFH